MSKESNDSSSEQIYELGLINNFFYEKIYFLEKKILQKIGYKNSYK